MLSLQPIRVQVAYVRAASVSVGADVFDRADGMGLNAADAVQYLVDVIQRGDELSIGDVGVVISLSVTLPPSLPPLASASLALTTLDAESRPLVAFIATIGAIFALVCGSVPLIFRRRAKRLEKALAHRPVKDIEDEIKMLPPNASTLVSNWRLNVDELELFERIGVGAQADVWRGAWRFHPTAIKQLRSLTGQSQEAGKFLLREVRALSRVRHSPSNALCCSCGALDAL